MKKITTYYIGITLTGIIATLLLPVFMLAVGVLRVFTFLWDSLCFPYQTMVLYDTKFRENYGNPEESK